MTAATARISRLSIRSTPGQYRLMSLVVVIVLGVAAAAAALAGTAMRSATREARDNSGPVLVATQGVVSSLAEADAAATAAFFSGADEDPEQRRLYEQALARATEQIEDIASLAGEEPTTHAVLRDVSVQVTRYAGLVEAARAGNKAKTPAADDDLVAAVTLLDRTVARDAQELTEATQARLGDDEGDRRQGYPLGVAGLVAGLLWLAAVQLVTAVRSRRLLNPLLVAATALVAVALSWLVAADQRSADRTETARTRGYDSIAFTARLQTTAFSAKADETLALITGDPARRASADRALASLADSPVTPGIAKALRDGTAAGAPGGLIGQAGSSADTPRERAAVTELAQRWQRYRDTVVQLRSASTPDAARAVAVGPLGATFNAFNFSVEAALGQNRDQFLAGLDDAADAASSVPPVALLLPLIAAAVALGGIQLRINDYR